MGGDRGDQRAANDEKPGPDLKPKLDAEHLEQEGLQRYEHQTLAAVAQGRDVTVRQTQGFADPDSIGIAPTRTVPPGCVVKPDKCGRTNQQGRREQAD